MISASSALLRTTRSALCTLSLASAPLLAAGTSTPADSADRLSYVFYADGSSSSMGSGNSDDWRRAKALRSGNAPFLYVRDGAAAYVIRDAATLAKAKAIMAPQQALGAQQGVLGNQQGELGAKMRDASAREMAEIGRQQAVLGQQQSELGAQQSALGAKQAELGREQSRLAKLAEPQLRVLVKDALQRGAAQRVQ